MNFLYEDKYEKVKPAASCCHLWISISCM